MEDVDADSWESAWGCGVIEGMVLRSELCLSLLPARAALKGNGEQMVHESGHGDLPVTGFVIEGADNEPRHARHVISWSCHEVLCFNP